VAERRFIRLFIAWYLFFMIFIIISYSLISLHPIVPFVFLFLFLSWHLVPILFLNIYLENHHGKASSVKEGFESRLSAIVEEYDISKREREVIQLICKGLTNQEIGDTLFISLQTVKDHIHRIFLKTGVKNRVQLTNLIRFK
jgi:DNA-binding CsgD family transcriptional regulator